MKGKSGELIPFAGMDSTRLSGQNPADEITESGAGGKRRPEQTVGVAPRIGAGA
jgi:hypothetical protein